LDPFLGSGTTIKVALSLERNCIGYEINEKFLPIIKKKIGMNTTLLRFSNKIEIIKRDKFFQIEEVTDYTPNIKDAKPKISHEKLKLEKDKLFKVINVLNEDTIQLDNGQIVKLLGIEIIPEKINEAKRYLEEYIKGKQIYLKFDPLYKPENDVISAYVFLKNKIFVNKEMIRQNFAEVQKYNFKYRDNFMKI